ncbi:J domain-containing protein [cf. Phormidesmis sp. LEGE 11477]|uniref:J domain-containing protein n=1 Tax=cf. Phormidesmis sp. LEGE 11477 TaxID=1828680 RepID=UPI001D158595|nr:J domain-containing protein [cf. Phormidesmis sp. LEGE 11477]
MQSGLFQLDMIDHHAVLGFSLAADAKQARKRYLKVARQLHPDSLRGASEEQRQLASQLLSKRVNPAYEVLSQDKSAREHEILLKMKQQQLAGSPNLVAFTSDRAQKLLNSNTVEAEYEAAIQQIASQQFEDLNQVDSAVNELSQLNAAYLIKMAKLKSVPAASKPADTASKTTGSPTSQNSARSGSVRPRRSSSILDSYIRRAKEFEAQRDYSRGILELREAIDSHPKSAPCHAYLSSLYLRSGQTTMAKIHMKQALALDPENQTAQTVQAELSAGENPAGRKQTASRSGANAQKAPAKGTKKGKQGGGLLSGLFGGKKK